MAQFRGIVEGSRGQASRTGDKKSGLMVIASSWKGQIRVLLSHDEEADRDCYRVLLDDIHGGSKELAYGAFGLDED